MDFSEICYKKSAKSPYRWILFDADDTLFDFSRSSRYAFEHTLMQFQIAFSPEHWSLYENINKEMWSALERREINAQQLRETRFARFLNAIGVKGDPQFMNAFYLDTLSRFTFLIEDALSVARQFFEKGLRMGLVTNGLREVQRPRLSCSALSGYFEVVVVSDEIGVSKPHRDFFDYTFREMGNPHPSQVLLVGDNLHSDIKGGNDYGMDTCWFNPQQAPNPYGLRPRYEIRKLTELSSIVEL